MGWIRCCWGYFHVEIARGQAQAEGTKRLGEGSWGQAAEDGDRQKMQKRLIFTAAQGRSSHFQAVELDADVLIIAPKHLMAINLFFLRTSPVGAQCCCLYFTNEQWRQVEAVSPTQRGCSPSLPLWPLWCRFAGVWLVWCPTASGSRLGKWGRLSTCLSRHAGLSQSGASSWHFGI